MKWDAFDIVGPVMVGPSSSHTSGAVRLGLFVYELIGGVPETATIFLHGSYADVYQGHGTDKALIAGLLGYAPDSERVVESFTDAEKLGLKFKFECVDLGNDYHVNTAKFVVTKGEINVEVVGESIGGGNINIVEIDKIRTTSLNGKLETLLIMQHDKPNVAASITNVLGVTGVNIAQMSIDRKAEGSEALTTITTDQAISEDILNQIKNLSNIIWARKLSPLT